MIFCSQCRIGFEENEFMDEDEHACVSPKPISSDEVKRCVKIPWNYDDDAFRFEYDGRVLLIEEAPFENHLNIGYVESFYDDYSGGYEYDLVCVGKLNKEKYGCYGGLSLLLDTSDIKWTNRDLLKGAPLIEKRTETTKMD